MATSDIASLNEAQIEHLFEEAGLMDAPAPDMRRVENVLIRATHERVIADTTSFVFKGFPAVISSFASVASGTIPKSDDDYRA